MTRQVQDAYIVAATRTPIGKAPKGVFLNTRPDDLLERDYQHHGRVDVGLLRAQLPLKPYHFYICGPTPMMASLVSALEDWGVPDARIHFEAFGPASIKRRSAAAVAPPAATTGADIVVTFAQSGKQLAWQPSAGSLLEFAEANGISVNSGCRAGGCGTCQATCPSSSPPGWSWSST